MHRIVPKKVATAVMVCDTIVPISAHPHIFEITTINVASAGRTMIVSHFSQKYRPLLSVPFFIVSPPNASKRM